MYSDKTMNIFLHIFKDYCKRIYDKWYRNTILLFY